MAEKVIVDIEVKGAQWENFNKLYDAYTKKLKQSQSVWDGTANKIDNAAKSASLLEQAMTKINASADRFANRIEQTTKNFLKWGAIFAIMKGLVGSGGHLFGIEKLAADAAATRRVAQGLGMDYGSMQSFKYNFQRIVDAQALMGNVSTAKYDVTSGARLGLMGLGLGGKEEMKKDPAEISRDVIKKIPDILKNVDPSMWLAVAKARHITDLVSEEDVIRIMNTSAEDRKYADEQYELHKKDLTLTKEQQNAWSKLMVQLNIAGQSIETTFQKRLVFLAPELEKLSRALVVAADWMGERLGNAIKPFADELSKMTDEEIKTKLDDWLASVGKFLDDMNDIFKGISTFVDWLNEVTGANKPQKQETKFGENSKLTVAPGATVPTVGQAFSQMLGLGGGGPGSNSLAHGGGASLRNAAYRGSGSAGADVAPVEATATTSAFLAEQRKSRIAELNSDPALRNEFMRAMRAEAGYKKEKLADVMEATFNRASMNNQTIRQQIHSGFFGPVNRNAPGFTNPLTKTEATAGGAALGDIAGGRNRIQLRTDQGMIVDPGARRYEQMPDKSGKLNFGDGNNYYFMGDKGRRWASETARKMRETDDKAAKAKQEAETKKALDEKVKAAEPKEEAPAAKPGQGGGDKSGTPQASNMDNFQGAHRQMAINLYSKPGSNTIISGSQVGGLQHA